MTASVLMSIFNETEGEVRASVMSVLGQTFNDFELIIIHDNPSCENRSHMVDWLRKLDSRITVIENDENIGLAMSMNKAFEIANGEYIIRMDSDDICEQCRFEREIDMLETKKWDLVFSNYTYIDSNGQILNDGQPALEKKEREDSLLSDIIFDGIIHHPTVAMTREIFLKAGKYRDFPCSQDLDLWLRMIDCGCRFLYLNETLLQYRIRENSTTGSNRLKQHLTITYIIGLFEERITKGFDNYSISQYNQFINTKITEKNKRVFARAINCLQNALHTDSQIKRFILRIRAFLFCKPLRNSYVYKKTHEEWYIQSIRKARKGAVTII